MYAGDTDAPEGDVAGYPPLAALCEYRDTRPATGVDDVRFEQLMLLADRACRQGRWGDVTALEQAATWLVVAGDVSLAGMRLCGFGFRFGAGGQATSAAQGARMTR